MLPVDDVTGRILILKELQFLQQFILQTVMSGLLRQVNDVRDRMLGSTLCLFFRDAY